MAKSLKIYPKQEVPVQAETAVEGFDSRNKKKYYFTETFLRRIVVIIVRFIFLFIARIQYHGVENLPREGPVVLAANHLTNFDVFPMQLILPRPLFFIGKEELFRNPIMDWALRQLGAFPVYRGAHDEWAIQHALEVLEHGQVLAIFPEGKRSKGIGLRPAKSGAARLALGANCPIVPVAVHGTQYMLRHFPHRSHVRIIVGKPIYPKPEESQLALTDRIMYTIADMLPPESRGVYSKRPPGF